MTDFTWAFNSPLDPAAASTPVDLTPLGERFECLELLGRGGMGAVFRVRDRGTERELALKVLNDATEAGRERLLRREGQLTAALAHPGIVRVHSSGELGGVVFLAYELVEGCRPLIAAPGPEGRLEFVQRLCDVADAVGHAHEHGIVHRDLKPDNLLVDSTGRVRVADFGLAWTQGVERLTQSGAVVGTPLYMAPEAFARVQHDVRVDVWSLGVVLYEGLTGVPPFTGETLMHLMAAATKGRFERPRRLDPTISDGLEAVCLKALASDPERRYPDASTLANALREALAKPAGARRPPALALVLLGVAAFAVGGALVAGSALRAPEATEESSAAKLAAPAPAASPRPKSLSPKEIAAGARRLRRQGRLEDLAERKLQLESWLDEFPGHPSAAEVEERLVGLRRRVSRLEFTYPGPLLSSSDPQASFLSVLSDGRFAVARRGKSATLSVWSGVGDPLLALDTQLECGAASADGSVILLASQTRLQRFAVTANSVESSRAIHISRPLQHGARANVVCFVPGNERALIGFSAGGVVEVDLASGTITREYTPTTQREIRGLAVSPDGRWLFVSEWGKHVDTLGPPGVGLFDFGSWKQLAHQVFDGRPRVVLTGDGETAIVGGAGQDLWRVSYGSTGLSLAGSFRGTGLSVANTMIERISNGRANVAHGYEIRDFAVWGERVYSVAGSDKPVRGDLRVWDIATGQELWRVDLGLVPQRVAAGPEGVLLLLGDDTLRVYPSE